MLDPRFRGDDKCIEHPSITDPLHKSSHGPLSMLYLPSNYRGVYERVHERHAHN